MIRRILSILILFFIVVISFLETMIWLLGADFSVSGDYLNLAILVLSLLALFILSGSGKKSPRDSKIILKNDKDSIIITENAVTQMVSNALTRIPAILGSDIVVKYSKEKKISLKISIILEAGSNIVEITSLVEQYVRESFTSILEESLEDIEVTIKGFKDTTK